MTNESLSVLADNIMILAGSLQRCVKDKDWEGANTHARALLALSSRSYGRISAIRDAQREMDN